MSQSDFIWFSGKSGEFGQCTIPICIQWGDSSPAKHGGAYFSAVVGPRILAITGEAIEKPYALHNSLGIHLARTFGATGKEQPSPPLHLAAAARLLSCRALRWCSCICLAQLVSISQFLANHISCLLLLTSPPAHPWAAALRQSPLCR